MIHTACLREVLYDAGHDELVRRRHCLELCTSHDLVPGLAHDLVAHAENGLIRRAWLNAARKAPGITPPTHWPVWRRSFRPAPRAAADAPVSLRHILSESLSAQRNYADLGRHARKARQERLAAICARLVNAERHFRERIDHHRMKERTP
ncbi:hypothetical protein HT136_19745 [Novosphingobium profundi]|uniref:hypothetical protein n=1 Tax=Novosphingobium profundi TaxID=1774954 RepID=UPI001BDB3C58|nr:hypothetical protein [Novosphingobium profundi]MBT0670605.1 hypothetical protein [Novosphingobium profundi]